MRKDSSIEYITIVLSFQKSVDQMMEIIEIMKDNLFGKLNGERKNCTLRSENKVFLKGNGYLFSGNVSLF